MSDATLPAISVNERIRRAFRVGSAEIGDPDPNMTTEQVRQMLAQSGYPQLTNATVTGPEVINGKHIWTFAPAVKTKG